ncbi:hypothetical protein OP10G_1478 [Fimbriimonas ginsengisoli Gsoil 348]|uniref:Uncharacterized protein n=1 Tax=Fimbriimonas ginsengisoli Gsoil 348 TaxID=661478 RepID=A0A068NN03_FIMGI|nr:hypothetical protein OP10G_1478 [Fimbriimonas ginsengisoli Gsoil 348]
MAALVTTSLVAAQDAGHQGHHPQPTTSKRNHASGGAMGGMMQGMDMAKCMADMQAGQKKLEALAAKMNAAQGADRIDATSAVINEMVKQQGEMMQMCHMMMSQHMSGHRHGAKSAAKTHTHPK